MIKEQRSTHRHYLALMLGIFLSMGITLRAEEKTWTGVADASWLSGGNWSPTALLTDLDSVLWDSSSTENLSQTLDQNWSVTGLRVADAPSAITVLSGSDAFTLTNAGGIDMSAATADLTILADYHPMNNGTLHVAAGRTLTLSNVVATLNNGTTGATAGGGTVRILGSAQRFTDQFNAITLIVDGGSMNGNPPVRLSADSGSTVTVLVTNNGAVNITSGNSTRIHLGGEPNPESTNHFIVDGGSVSVSGSGSSGANGIYVGSFASTVGILDINNGTVDLSDRNGTSQHSVLRIGDDPGSHGTVNLNANGRLLTPRIDRISGYGIFNFNGGYLETTVARSDYFELVDEVNILEGGAVIDTGGRIVAATASMAGPGGLTKLGTGSLTLAGIQSYAGPTVISNGTLAVSLPLSSSSISLGSNSGFNVTVGNVADITWTPSSFTLESSNALTFTYGAGSEPSATLINTPNLSAIGTNVVNIGGTRWPVGTTRLIDYDGSINGNGKFVLGTLPVGLNAKLTNNPTTTSIDLVVSAGVNTLDWYGFTAFGPNSGGLWDISTTANWDGGASVYNEYGTGTNLLGDNVRFSPSGYAIVEIPGTVRPTSMVISNLQNTTYSIVGPGKISGPTSLIKEGNHQNSVLMISTVNDYTGGTFIKFGNIILGVENALPTNGIVYVGNPGTGASVALNGFNQTIGGLVAAGSGSGNRRIYNNSDTLATLTINVAANQTNAYTHTLGNPNIAQTDIFNNFAIVKTGPGIQTFANCGYGGSTTISEGTLLFNSSGNSSAAALTGEITVQSGGTVGGNNTGDYVVGAPITVLAGGRIEPGNLGIGTFTVSNSVTLQGEAFLEINRANSPIGDKLVANSISFGGTLTVANLGEALQGGDTFILFSGALSGNFSGVVLPSLNAGLEWNTNDLASAGTISVVALPLPTFQSPTLSGNELILSGTGGAPNGVYYVLTSTNIALPLASWTSLATNNFDETGAFSFTNVVNPASPQRFFSLGTP